MRELDALAAARLKQLLQEVKQEALTEAQRTLRIRSAHLERVAEEEESAYQT